MVFSNAREIDYWFIKSDQKDGIELKRSNKYFSEGNYSMQINWETKERPELIFVHFPQDWSNYKYFSFDIFNPICNAKNEFVSGLYNEDTKLCVNRDIGTTGIPLRFFCKPEITVFNFN